MLVLSHVLGLYHFKGPVMSYWLMNICRAFAGQPKQKIPYARIVPATSSNIATSSGMLTI